MPKKLLGSLGAAVRTKRASRKLREVASEIGISAATLMRVENGRAPDLATFGKLCHWLNLDPRDFLGLPRQESAQGASTGPLVMSAHFRADKTPTPETVQALATMLLTAARAESSTKDGAPR